MAPTQPRPSVSPKLLKSILKKTPSCSNDHGESLFPNSKKDKRRIKHAQLMSKVTKSGTSKARRRRPGKKLVATLESLTDALPKTESTITTEAGVPVREQVNIIKRKSIKSQPGAMKRREKLDKGERDRFANNMAQMAVSMPAQNSAGNGTLDKWTALREFITQTLEQRSDVQPVKS